ncbi:MAG: cysteine desulfurase NifS [Clostridia bacterium]|nr:cysteine desulfurase NifS [Clostridia bacterium]
MQMKIRYFDHAATTYVKLEVLKEMLPYFRLNYGNPSSLYSIGRKSKKAIDIARKRVAEAINAKTKEIYFTSCGSESDNLAIKGVAYANKNKGKHIITSKIEHPAVLNTCKRLEEEGFEITYLNVDCKGRISIEELENAIKEDTILITIMFANNEIGTIEPIEEIGKIAKKHNIIFHTDCVQAIGNVKIDVKKFNIDLLSISAHKFYGPKGVGVLYVKESINFQKLQDGGHQEKDKRAGTENVAGIVGIGKAIELANLNLERYNKKLTFLKDYCINQIEKNFKNVKLNGSKINRLPGNINYSFSKINGEELLLKLDEYGICVSSGSACSSGNDSPSHVLKAIGVKEEYINGTIRITLGEENTKQDVDFLIRCLKEIIPKISK